jgi:hypothetical protein
MTDRKTLIRQYKENRRPMGIFRVRNVANGKSLVGACVDLPAMLNRQEFQLRSGGHPNRELQKDWDASGPDAFRFEVVETLTIPDRQDYDPADDLKTLEELWLESLSPYGERGYNVKPPSKK